jgi:hypothetical protein
MNQPFLKLETAKSIIEDIYLSLADASLKNKKDELIRKSLEADGYNLESTPDREYCVEHDQAKYTYTAAKGSIPSCTAKFQTKVYSHSSLESEFDALENDKVLQREMSVLENECNGLFSVLRSIFNECENLPDLYTVLPNSLHKFLPKITYEEPTLKGDPFERIKKMLAGNDTVTGNPPDIIKKLYKNLSTLNAENILTEFSKSDD